MESALDESSSFSVSTKINSNQYELQYLGCWGGPWESEPTDIPANSSKTFTLNDNDRGGIWYRAIDPATQDEAGFVTMSFTCPMLSSNSAEGSPDNGPFVSAGLQTYSESGHPFSITYNVGTPNLACWGSGTQNDGSTVCPQTTFGDKRLIIEINNPNNLQLGFGDYWNGDAFSEIDWYWQPSSRDVPPPGCIRTIIIKENCLAGLYLKVLSFDRNIDVGFANMSFQTSMDGTNFAEGSPGLPDDTLFFSPGLQTYAKSNPTAIRYNIGSPNMACWNSGTSDDGKINCSQTNFADMRALIKIQNLIPEALTFDGYWNDNKGGKSNWYIEPCTNDSMRAEGARLFVLRDNDRAGLYFKQSWMEFHMSFTCPKLSSNSAEGSPHTGLQTYLEKGTPVTFTYNVGTPNLACWQSGSSANGRTICKQTLVHPFDLRRWMGKLNEKYPDTFKNQTLRNLFIPSSHDAACYAFPQDIVAAHPFVLTQQLNFSNQLIKGLRHFDLRPFYDQGTFQPHKFHHDIFETLTTLDDLILQVVNFYSGDWDKRQYEIIILDFTHFMNYKQTDETYKLFFDKIFNSTLNQYLIPQGTFGPNTSLTTMWTASTTQRVIASVNADAYAAYQAITGSKPNIWNGTSLFASGWDGSKFWPNKSNKSDLIDFINSNIDGFSENTNLWVLQDILTASPTQSVYSLADKAHAALYESSGLAWRSKANLVMQDYYDECTTIEAIMENIKRLS